MRRNTSGHPAPRVQDTVRLDIGGARPGPLSRPAPPRVRSRRCPKQQSLLKAQLGLGPACAYGCGLVHACLQTSCWLVQFKLQGALPAGFATPVVGPTTTQAF